MLSLANVYELGVALSNRRLYSGGEVGDVGDAGYVGERVLRCARVDDEVYVGSVEAVYCA